VWVAANTLHPTDGMGPTISAVTDTIELTLGAASGCVRVERVGIRYPASLMMCRSSRIVGAAARVDDPTMMHARCSEQRFVLTGLSQGATIVRDALGFSAMAASVADRVEAIVSLATRVVIRVALDRFSTARAIHLRSFSLRPDPSSRRASLSPGQQADIGPST
jgi:hypothetical protein